MMIQYTPYSNYNVNRREFQMIDKSNFFYASDLAQLYNISKQTLIFYDKKDLFKPDYVDSNGYRMYSLKQFFILGIILDLKTMGFHLNDIKNFLEHRTPDDTLSLLKKQLHKLTKQIELTSKLCDNIKSKINTINVYNDCKLNEITLSYREEEYFLVSEEILLSSPQKERFLTAATLLNSAVDKNGLKEYSLSGFIFNEDISDFSPESYKVFCKTNKSNHNYVKPYGLYLQICVNTNFADAVNTAKPLLINFCKALNLKTNNIIYIKTLRNYWSTDSHDNFISKIEVPVL